MQKNKLSLFFVSIFFLCAVIGGAQTAQATPQYFGYYAWGSSSEIAGMASFSNIILPYYGLTASDWDLLAPNNMKVALDVQSVFFYWNYVDKWIPYPDYAQRWSDFVSANSITEHYSDIATFYLADEPTWVGITYNDLKTAADYLKSQYPSVPISIVEAVPGIAGLVVPTSIDWIGFDQYYILDPSTNESYQYYHSLLKSKRSRSDQKIIIVTDAWYGPQHVSEGLSEGNMATVAANYYKVAQSDSDVIAMIGYIWPSGGSEWSFGPWIGAGGMSAVVRNEYKRIGQLITGKSDDDIADPTVTAFTIPSTATSLTVTITTFTATDTVGVTGYKLTESATAPLAGDAGWFGSAPANYTFATEGAKTLYAWAKDAAGNVSGSLNDSVTITLPTYTIGGTISGLSGTVILQNNGGDNLTRSANGSFTFATAIHNGDAYSATVLTQPSGQTCVVSSGTGTVASGNITDVSLTCSDNSDTTPPAAPSGLLVQ